MIDQPVDVQVEALMHLDDQQSPCARSLEDQHQGCSIPFIGASAYA